MEFKETLWRGKYYQKTKEIPEESRSPEKKKAVLIIRCVFSSFLAAGFITICLGVGVLSGNRFVCSGCFGSKQQAYEIRYICL